MTLNNEVKNNKYQNFKTSLASLNHNMKHED